MKAFFPRASAWLSALALVVFAGALGGVMTWMYKAAAFVAAAPRVSAFFVLLGVVSPIVVVAFGNHFFHLVLDRWAGRKAPRGWAPGLMSWWTGLYAWLVLSLSMFTSVFIAMMISPRSNIFAFFELFTFDSNLASVLSVPTVVFFLVAAFLFQVERRVRDKMAAGPDSTV
jgi:hypothetical protein